MSWWKRLIALSGGLLLGATLGFGADNSPVYAPADSPSPSPTGWQVPYPQAPPLAVAAPSQPPMAGQPAVSPYQGPPAQGAAMSAYGQYTQLQPAGAPQYSAPPVPATLTANPLAQPPFQSGVPPQQGRPQVEAGVAAPGAYPSPLPPTGPEVIARPQPVNGTWRDEGNYVVIEVNGQQIRLAKTALMPQPAPTTAPVGIPVGSVHGRLLQRGNPLVNCTVVIVPMHQDGATDEGGVRRPVSTVTDADGVYCFVNVPAGSYKITWLPAGTTQWIRRIEMKPDVFVREGEDHALRDVKMAIQTIN